MLAAAWLAPGAVGANGGESSTAGSGVTGATASTTGCSVEVAVVGFFFLDLPFCPFLLMISTSRSRLVRATLAGLRVRLPPVPDARCVPFPSSEPAGPSSRIEVDMVLVVPQSKCRASRQSRAKVDGIGRHRQRLHDTAIANRSPRRVRVANVGTPVLRREDGENAETSLRQMAP